jgi:hypothetical protein
VDFNAVHEDGTLGISRRLIRGMQPEAGDQVQLIDSEGNRCVAVVREASTRGFRVALILDTWAVASGDYVVGGATPVYGAVVQSTSTSGSHPLPPRSMQRPDVAPQPSPGLPYSLARAS